MTKQDNFELLLSTEEMGESRDEGRKLKVLMGTCGWSDHTLLKCGRFYPASVRSAEDRLRHYSTHFPCVEVDTSTYAIPSKVSVRRWLQAVPSGFIFHFKAFGLFCSKSCPITAIPGEIRTKLSFAGSDDYVKLSSLSTDIQDEIWSSFNSTLEPVFTAGSLGVVLFQFHLSFKPSLENRTHVLWCRRQLDPRFEMAVEFRNRDWFVGEQFQATCEWLKANNMALVAADELAHETFQKDREQTGLPYGQSREVLPVAWAVTKPSFHYIRVHRREGCKRMLSDSELQTWVARLQSKLPETLQGPVYFMWGTDWEDQPILNAQNLKQFLPESMIFNWKAAQLQNPAKGSLLSMFKSPQTAMQTASDSVLYKQPATPTDDVSPIALLEMNKNTDFGCSNANLGDAQKRILEQPAEMHGFTKKDAVFPPPKKAKPSPNKKKGNAGSPTITSFFKYAR